MPLNIVDDDIMEDSLESFNVTFSVDGQKLSCIVEVLDDDGSISNGVCVCVVCVGGGGERVCLCAWVCVWGGG